MLYFMLYNLDLKVSQFTLCVKLINWLLKVIKNVIITVKDFYFYDLMYIYVWVEQKDDF